ncbi:MAG: anti-sigma factor [Phycisphaerales bacterium]
MSTSDKNSERLYELLAAQQLEDLSHDELDELKGLISETDDLPDEVLGDLLVMFDQHAENQDSMPAAFAESLVKSGQIAIATLAETGPIEIKKHKSGLQSTPSRTWYWATASAAAIAIGATIFGVANYSARTQATQQFENELASMQSTIANNESLLAASRIAAQEALDSINDLKDANSAQATELADALDAKLQLASTLAEATSSLDQALDQIALYETPLDPAQLVEGRRQLLTVPDSVQIAWQPFDLPDAPAEQQGVRGDVVWSDTYQEGYIRFVGLEPNDPLIEQYQIWVIDERGLEQKVSGGIFNATAEGEIIVPIHPGIDVGRVALFAITIENPGGTWVPDLSRRVVVAPRDG